MAQKHIVKIDFKKELEAISKGMIMVHDHKLLIKMIIRVIVGKLGVRHAAILMYDEKRKTYVLNISRGESGMKIPEGFTHFDHTNPIVEMFINDDYASLLIDRSAVRATDIHRLIWLEAVIDKKKGRKIKDLLNRVEQQMDLLGAAVCVPVYYQKNLQALFLLGMKKDRSDYTQEELDFFSALASNTSMAMRNAKLFGELREEVERNHKLFLQTISVLGSTIEAKDAYTHGHTERVTAYAILIAQYMRDKGRVEFSDSFLNNMHISGLLHDIGKIAIPENVLKKKGPLVDDEVSIMRDHPIKGVAIVEPLNLNKDILDGIRHHHERYDGGGYPEGLIGEKMPMIASILSVADAFDAMTSDRSYRRGFSKQKAIDIIMSEEGKQFHPLPSRALEELYKEGLLSDILPADFIERRFHLKENS